MLFTFESSSIPCLILISLEAIGKLLTSIGGWGMGGSNEKGEYFPSGKSPWGYCLDDPINLEKQI